MNSPPPGFLSVFLSMSVFELLRRTLGSWSAAREILTSRVAIKEALRAALEEMKPSQLTHARLVGDSSRRGISVLTRVWRLCNSRCLLPDRQSATVGHRRGPCASQDQTRQRAFLVRESGGMWCLEGSRAAAGAFFERGPRSEDAKMEVL